MAKKRNDNLLFESHDSSKLLIDTYSFTPTALLDEGVGNGKLRVRGEFAKAGVATENKRVYPSSLWEREFSRLNKALAERKILGECDHPESGRTSVKRASHIVTGLTLENGIVIGEAEIVDTSEGRNLQALLKAGAKVGVSSRGYGSTKANSTGEDVVQDDYRLVTFDFVAEPADTGAYPEPEIEETEEKENPMDLNKITVEELKKSVPKDVLESLWSDEKAAALAAQEKRLSAEWAKQIEDQKAKDEAAEPSIVASPRFDETQFTGATRDALTAIAKQLAAFSLSAEQAALLKSKEEEIAALTAKVAEATAALTAKETELAETSKVAKQLGFTVLLAQLIEGDEHADIVKAEVGDVTAFESSEALKARVEAIQADIKAQVEAEAEIRAEIEAAAKVAIEEKDAKIAVLESHVAKLSEAVEAALEANKEMALHSYTEQKLRLTPHAEALRPILEKVSTKEEVDKILQEARPPKRDTDELEAVRARVRKMARGGVTPVEEETSVDDSDFLGGIGVGSISDFKSLSGIKGS